MSNAPTMVQTTQELARAIASAERERKVWNEGRLAFRADGIATLNPYSPRTSDHALWAEGFAHGRAKADEQRLSSLLLP